MGRNIEGSRVSGRGMGQIGHPIGRPSDSKVVFWEPFSVQSDRRREGEDLMRTCIILSNQ